MPFASLSSTLFRAQNRVRIVWGEDDAVTGRLCIVLSRLFVKRTQLEITKLPGASHWLVDQRPADIAAAVEALGITQA